MHMCSLDGGSGCIFCAKLLRRHKKPPHDPAGFIVVLFFFLLLPGEEPPWLSSCNQMLSMLSSIACLWK